MNVDRILKTLNRFRVDFLLIGGMNFLLRHQPVLTYDLDVWVADTDANLAKLNRALQALGAQWGPTEKEWAPVSAHPDWLQRQPIFCLTTRHGALDIFREVRGLEGRYAEGKMEAVRQKTASGVSYRGLSDRHMLISQEALPVSERKPERVALLRQALGLGESEIRESGAKYKASSPKQREERKRERAFDPGQRWKLLQRTITWAEANMAPKFRRNRPRPQPSAKTRR